MSSNKWDIYNPRLWYRDDLKNHPELIPLEGQTVDYETVGNLAKAYNGSVLLSTQLTKLQGDYFTNGSISLKVNKFDGLYVPTSLFGDTMSVNNISHTTDQWLTGDPNVNSMHTVTIKFDKPTLLTEYWMIAAIGTATIIDKERPSPKHWLVYGSNDSERWDVLDERDESADNWGYWHINSYNPNSVKAYRYIKIVISAWHPTEDSTLSTGLKRLYLFGRPSDKFTLPNIPSPNDSFVWVVPNRELD